MQNGTDIDARDSTRVLMSGASGMLGSAIAQALLRRGTGVLRLVRRDPQTPHEFRWNPVPHNGSTHASAAQISGMSADDIQRLEGIDAIIHLSGANVAARRWTTAYKQEMTASRVITTRALAEMLAQMRYPPETLITASAVGFYGDRGDEILDESSVAGRGFFADLCSAWEAAAQPAVEIGVRVIHLRFGMVIGHGGAMAKLAPLFRMGIAGRLGSGRQWISWVSEADAVGIVLFLLDQLSSSRLQTGILSGPVNAVAPEPVTNAKFTSELAHAVNRPAVLPAPAFALRLAFGEMADEALLASIRAVPRRLIQAEYAYRCPTLSEAFAAVL